jgi:crotonobetainyl-CoA:carnitine CoA-transferase CaiB-like acyl-CoA transferase
MSYATPFAGLKCIDLSQGVAGPYCAMLLAQHGADVIKVEPPGEGDWARALGTRYADQSAFSIPANLGKRSIVLDLKTERAKEIVWRLVENADIFIQGFRPGVIERLGFGYDAVAAREPKIIYVSVSGFGQTGPMADRPAMDPVLQAFTGLIAENKGMDGLPHRVPIIAIDMSTGLYAFSAVSTSLYARVREAKGRHIEASLLQSAAGLQVIRMMGSYLDNGAVHPASPPSGIHRTADGWMSVTVIRGFEWTAFCEALDLAHLAADPRYATPDARIANADTLLAILRPMFAERPGAHWSERMTAKRVMHERLNTYTEFVRHPHLAECGALAWLEQPGVPQPYPMPNLVGLPPFVSGTARATAPARGQHTSEILREHGYSGAEIGALAAAGVIGGAPALAPAAD